MRSFPATAAIAAIAAIAAGTAGANEFESAINAYVESELTTWANDPVLVTAIRSQNDTTSSYSQSQIDELDRTWQAEVGAGDSELIRNVLDNPAAGFLRARLEAAGGAITEIFVMDARGLNVAASDVTSDYWQGDEAKWQKSYGAGAGTIFVDEVEKDESTQTLQTQASIAISDPATKEVIGALTVGIDVSGL